MGVFVQDNPHFNLAYSKGFKLIILDEADMMTNAAQSALRRVIEQYTKNVRFCIICNYVNKITPAIQSRCTRFRFSPLPMEEVEKRLIGVIETERYSLYFTLFVSVDPRVEKSKYYGRWQEGAIETLQRRHAARIKYLTGLLCRLQYNHRDRDIQLHGQPASLRYRDRCEFHDVR